MPTNLSPAQLAEGARLLSEVHHKDMIICTAYVELEAWLFRHADALLAAAQRTAEVEGCVRNFACEFKALCNFYGWDQAAVVLERLAARHNIDLSEPTPAGEAKGGDCERTNA